MCPDIYEALKYAERQPQYSKYKIIIRPKYYYISEPLVIDGKFNNKEVIIKGKKNRSGLMPVFWGANSQVIKIMTFYPVQKYSKVTMASVRISGLCIINKDPNPKEWWDKAAILADLAESVSIKNCIIISSMGGIHFNYVEGEITNNVIESNIGMPVTLYNNNSGTPVNSNVFVKGNIETTNGLNYSQKNVLVRDIR